MSCNFFSVIVVVVYVDSLFQYLDMDQNAANFAS